MRRLFCWLGLHRWARLATTAWLQEPSVFRNELGTAMEFRRCDCCPAIRDLTTWSDVADEYHGGPRGMGPLTGARFLEVMSLPFQPLDVSPIPITDSATAVCLSGRPPKDPA